MREIEKKMVRAVKGGFPFRETNTEVSICGSVASVYLYGHFIFAYDRSNGNWKASTAHHETVTTKSRLNALLDGIGANVCVVQRNYQFYLYADGKRYSFGCDFDKKMVEKLTA